MLNRRKKQIQIFAFSLLFCMVFSIVGRTYNKYSNLEEVHASGAVVSLVPYILSTLGVVNVLSNGQISSASGSIVDSIEQLVADAMGSGIYTDSNGNYVFSNDFTQSVYEALSASSEYDVRVVSSFTQNNDDIVNDSYFSPGLVQKIATMRATYDYYLLEYFQYIERGKNYTYVYCYDISNVSGLISGGTTSTGVDFLNANLQTGNSINYKYTWCSYSASEGYADSSSISSSSLWYLYNYGHSAPNYFGNDFFMKCPLFRLASGGNGPSVGYQFYSNRSLLIGRNAAAVSGSLNQNQGLFFNNNGIPSISQTAIENNNWDNIYNNYVQNVAENYYSENPDTFDQDLLRKWMRQYSNNIIASIQAGVEDLEGAITTSNNWLRMIYDKLSEINTTGGGGSCNWTEEDIETLLTKVNAIDLGVGETVDEMILIYGLLDDILDALRDDNGPSPDLVDWIDNLPDLEILDTIAKMDIVASALEAVVPMCYLAALGAILGGLATDPEPVDIDIPFAFTSTNGISVDEDVSVDLTVFNTVHTILIAAEVIAYICFLMIASFRLLQMLLDIFGGG